jgi:tetratricopeptide (TPR) repeat protein
LIIPRVSYGEWDTHAPLPWRWPADLVELLQASGVRTEFVTIAYSVEGGHTPPQWKYLGGELACRLRFPDAGDDRLAPYARMREGALARYDGDDARAEAAFRNVGDKLEAAPYFWLAHLLAAKGRIDEGRCCYDRALALDPSYRTAYSTAGLTLYFARSYAAAERAFCCTLLLDPANPYANLGLGWVAARRGRWQEAQERARACLARQPDSVDAHRLLAKALETQGRLEEAIEAYEQSLKLALAGRTPFNGVTVTDPDGDRLLDSDHARIHAQLARLYGRTGDSKRAITSYRIAIAGGFDIPLIRFRLARLYVRQHRKRDAWLHTSAGLKKTPRALRAAPVRIWRHLSQRWDRITMIGRFS